MDSKPYTAEERAAREILRRRHGQEYVDSYWGTKDAELVLENKELIDLQMRLTKACELLRDMTPSHVPKGTCWCEHSRDVSRFGHMKRCIEAAAFLAEQEN